MEEGKRKNGATGVSDRACYAARVAVEYSGSCRDTMEVERVVPNALAWARVIGLGTSRSTLMFQMSEVRCLSVERASFSEDENKRPTPKVFASEALNSDKSRAGAQPCSAKPATQGEEERSTPDVRCQISDFRCLRVERVVPNALALQKGGK
jgi:hypothetical protein